MTEEQLRVKIAELSEALKYADKRSDQHDQEIKSLHRENAKQSEEIRDAFYLADSLKGKIEEFTDKCGEYRACNFDDFKELKEELRELKSKLENTSEVARKAATSRLVLIIQSITATLIVTLTVVGAILGWFSIGG